MQNLMNVCMIAGAVFSYSQGIAQEPEEPQPAKTNLEAYRSLATEIAADVAAGSGVEGTEASVTVLPREQAWYIEGAVRDGIQSKGFRVVADSGAAVSFEFGMAEAVVRYENIRKDGFFGAKLLDRHVVLSLDAKVKSKWLRPDSVAFRARTHTFSDVVELSDVARIENPVIQITKGAVPREGLFTSVVEPLVLIGSIAVAVFLLFNVRS